MGLAALKEGKGSHKGSEYSRSMLTRSLERKNGKGLGRG